MSTVESTQTLERRLALVEARQAIERCIKQYAHSADRLDMEPFLDIFHADSTHIHTGYYDGLSIDFAKLGFDMFRDATAWSMHYITNIEADIDLDEGVAHTECYFYGAFLVRADAPEGALGGHVAGKDEYKWVGGRYFQRFERRADTWKIAHMTGVLDWEQWADVDARGFVRNIGDVPAKGPYG
jgi:hypothetical protein